MNSFSPFHKGLAMWALGGGVTLMEFLRGASLVLVVVGGILSAVGGWYAMRTKRLEMRIKEIEVADKLREHGGS